MAFSIRVYAEVNAKVEGGGVLGQTKSEYNTRGQWRLYYRSRSAGAPSTRDCTL